MEYSCSQMAVVRSSHVTQVTSSSSVTFPGISFVARETFFKAVIVLSYSSWQIARNRFLWYESSTEDSSDQYRTRSRLDAFLTLRNRFCQTNDVRSPESAFCAEPLSRTTCIESYAYERNLDRLLAFTLSTGNANGAADTGIGLKNHRLRAIFCRMAFDTLTNWTVFFTPYLHFDMTSHTQAMKLLL